MNWFFILEDQSFKRKNKIKLGVKGLNPFEHSDLPASEKQKSCN